MSSIQILNPVETAFLHHLLKLVNVGDATVMIPSAAAIAAWLFTGRAWRMALWWCFLFAVGISIVIASKIIFLAWGLGIHSIDFKALSGHAMQTTAVMPVAFNLLLQRYPATLQLSGTLIGFLLGTCMTIFLMSYNFHSVSEALAGWAIGATVSLGFIGVSDALPKLRPNRCLLPCSILVFIAVWYANPASFNDWMKELALHLSGSGKTYSLLTGEIAR